MDAFTKADIEKIRLKITSGEQSLLDMNISKDGMLARQGNGQFPVASVSVVGQTPDDLFEELVDSLADNVFEYANVYDHPDKSGIPITYSVVFIGAKPKIKVFEFRVGSETKDVGKLLPYFDNFIVNAVKKTEAWYNENK